jgi:hypothetical protein
MAEKYVSNKQLATLLGMDPSAAMKYVKKGGIRIYRMVTPDSNHQLTNCVTLLDAQRLKEERDFGKNHSIPEAQLVQLKRRAYERA